VREEAPRRPKGRHYLRTPTGPSSVSGGRLSSCPSDRHDYRSRLCHKLDTASIAGLNDRVATVIQSLVMQENQVGVGSEVPDVHSQLEDLLHQVWLCEADWRLNDRLDLRAKMDRVRSRKA
jgi:hypothetical protein